MPNISLIGQVLPAPQPTIQLPVYTHPQITPDFVKGFIYVPSNDQQRVERLIESRQVRYGEELAFLTDERGMHIEYQVIGVKIVDGVETTVAGKRGHIDDLDALHSIHLA